MVVSVNPPTEILRKLISHLKNQKRKKNYSHMGLKYVSVNFRTLTSPSSNIITLRILLSLEGGGNNPK